MKTKSSLRLVATLAICAIAIPAAAAQAAPPSTAAPFRSLAVGPQYTTTHVYVTRGSVAAFTTSWEAVFGGTNSVPAIADVTPTPSETISELIKSPVGTLSIFDFQTPIPYPFGVERNGLLLADFPTASRRPRSAARICSSARSTIRSARTRSCSFLAESMSSCTGTPRHRSTPR
jgi:hypothetical protein